MVRVTMTEKGKEKKVITDVFCDECGRGLSWNSEKFSCFVGVSLAKSILRKEGWRFGKKHRCKTCILKKKNI